MKLPGLGELKELIDILEVCPPFNAATGEGIVKKKLAEGVWAKIEPLGGGMDAETMDVQSCRQQYRIWIRYLEGVTAFHQLEWSGRRLIIDGPLEHMEQWLLLHAYSVTTRKI